MIRQIVYGLSAAVALTAQSSDSVTFNQDVYPILERRCEPCHKPGGIAPMRFLDYKAARPWAKAIRDAVKRKKMPPWFRESGTLEFSNDRALTAGEISTITAWADSGAVEGDPSTAPKSKHWPSSTVGSFEADLEVSPPIAFPVSPGTDIPYQYVVLPAGNSSDRWITQVEILPGARELVHHVVAYIREPADPWLKDAPRGRMHVPPTKDRQTKADILAVYTPGAQAVAFPEGMAKKLPAGADIVLQFHYTPVKSIAMDRTRVRMRYGDAPSKRILTLQMGQDNIEIPPYERSYRTSVSGTLPNDAQLLSLMPHMHLRGVAFDFDIVGERGRVENLLRVRPFDFYWQLTYWLKTPRLLPKGTRLRFTGYFDNSANNPRNPNPADTVHWGEQSWEEMMIGFFDIAVDPEVDKKSFFVR